VKDMAGGVNESQGETPKIYNYVSDVRFRPAALGGREKIESFVYCVVDSFCRL